jgi:hypothetical protein
VKEICILSPFCPDFVSFLAACAGKLLNCPDVWLYLWVSGFPFGLSKGPAICYVGGISVPHEKCLANMLFFKIQS